jgi:WD40 repeat protein
MLIHILVPCCSSDGSLLTYAAEDLSIGVINASTLQPVYRLRNAHQNPIFTITMSSDNSFIASAAGNQLRVTPLPKTISKGKVHVSRSSKSKGIQLLSIQFVFRC